MSRRTYTIALCASLIFGIDKHALLESSLRVVDGTATAQDSLNLYGYDKTRFSSYKVEGNKKGGVQFNGLKDLDQGASFIYGINHPLRDRSFISISDSSLIRGNDRTHFNVAHKKSAKYYFIWFDQENDCTELSASFESSSSPNNLVTRTLGGHISGEGFHDLYIIVSKTRLTELESLLDKYTRIMGVNKPAVATRISSQIRSTLENMLDPGKNKRYVNRLERPIEIGMAYRSDAEELRQTSLTDIVEGDEVAIKRITIEYR